MAADSNSTLRLAVIAELARRLDGRIGRTALMKLTYFLQELRKVPLGYSYRIHTYGPYDPQVLTDLKIAEGLGAVQSKQFEWHGGSGYALKAGEWPGDIIDSVKPRVDEISDDIDWVVAQFGALSAQDLEVASTIVYVVASKAQDGEAAVADEVVREVHLIKPHHNQPKILSQLTSLQQKQVVTLHS